MSPLIIRIIVALILLVIMIYQAIHAPKSSYKRHAFSTASVALALMALSNGAAAMGALSLAWMVSLLWVIALLFLASLVLLGLAWRNGEMQGQVERMREAFAHERARRSENEAPQSSAAQPDHQANETETERATRDT